MKCDTVQTVRCTTHAYLYVYHILFALCIVHCAGDLNSLKAHFCREWKCSEMHTISLYPPPIHPSPPEVLIATWEQSLASQRMLELLATASTVCSHIVKR